jgi:flavin reductase (DIM6/NTAB) family NADH-FMN oxidoreductase RutF
MIIDPKTFDRFNLILTGVVVPRPIAFVSTISTDGVVNLAPYSFFNAVAYNPPTVVFSSSRKAAGWQDKRKDTLTNIEETGEFVVNVVVDPIAAAMNATAAEYPSDVSEFDVAGLTEAPSEMVKAPRVAESPVNMECRLVQVVNIGEQPHQHGLVIGEILRMHVRDDVLYEGPNGYRVNHQALQPTGRLAGNSYCRTDDVYELIRPHYVPEENPQEAGRAAD